MTPNYCSIFVVIPFTSILNTPGQVVGGFLRTLIA